MFLTKRLPNEVIKRGARCSKGKILVFCTNDRTGKSRSIPEERAIESARNGTKLLTLATQHTKHTKDGLPTVNIAKY